MQQELINVKALLPRDWRIRVLKKLTSKGIQMSAMSVTKIFNGYKKNDPDEKKVLEAILKVKDEYQIEKTEKENLRKSIAAAE